MATETETEVKDGVVVPDPEIETEETDPESSPENDPEGDDPEGDDPEPEAAPVPKKVEVPAAPAAIAETRQRLEGETDREYAFRMEIIRLRSNNRQQRGTEVVNNPPARAAKPAVNEAQKKILDKYKPEELQALREVLPVLAGELGYVREGDLQAKQYTDIAQEQIDEFIKEHPEYSPEKDPDNILWGKLSQEYKDFYKQPENPKNLKKIFDRIHRDIFGIEAKGPLPKTTAAKEKIKVASHTGASAPTARREGVRPSGAASGLRLDMLRGFSDEDKTAIESRATE